MKVYIKSSIFPHVIIKHGDIKKIMVVFGRYESGLPCKFNWNCIVRINGDVNECNDNVLHWKKRNVIDHMIILFWHWLLNKVICASYFPPTEHLQLLPATNSKVIYSLQSACFYYNFFTIKWNLVKVACCQERITKEIVCIKSVFSSVSVILFFLSISL